MKKFVIEKTVDNNTSPLYNCVFENLELAQKILVEYSKNMGYKIRYDREGNNVIGSMYVNEKKEIRIILLINTIEVVDNYKDFLKLIN